MKFNQALIYLFALLFSAQLCRARVVFGLLDAANVLVQFDSATTTNIISRLAITNLDGTEKLLGIDFRPFNGRLYALTSANRLYTINTITGAATLASTLQGTCTTPGTNVYGVDFNPTVDRLRIISSSGTNYAVNVDDGSCTINTAITPVGASLIQVAYSNNFRGASTTTLYAIDGAASTFGTIATPASGVYTQTGPLTVTTANLAGLDSVDTLLWASLSSNNVSSLYSVNPASGAATVVGVIGNNIGALRSISISLSAISRTYFALAVDGTVVRFESEDASSVVSSPVTGLGNEFMLGFDFRPANGLLYAVTNASRVYVLNPLTYAAQLVATVNCTFVGAYFGVDWNPSANALRIIGDSGASYRLNVDAGFCFIDGSISSTTALVPPRIGAVGYTNSFVNPPSTTLYGLDFQGDSVGTIAPPNAGVYNYIANLSVVTGPNMGFDIFGSDNIAVCIIEISVEANSYLMSINLANGLLSFIAQPGTVLLRSLSAGFQRFPWSPNGFYPSAVVLTSAAPQQAVMFSSTSTTTATLTAPITGLAAGTTLLGMDLRPATNQIVGLGSDQKIYVITPGANSVMATWVATANCTLSSTSLYSFDFNPVANLLRIVSRTGENYRVNVDTGLCLVDTNLLYVSGGTGVPSAVGVAYTNSVSPTPSTTAEYILDDSNDSLAQVTNPNGGVTAVVGPTGVAFSGSAPFDVLTNGGQQQAFAVLSGALYSINLGTGVALSYGALPATATGVIGLTILPNGYTPPPPPTAMPITTTTTSGMNMTSTLTSTGSASTGASDSTSTSTGTASSATTAAAAATAAATSTTSGASTLPCGVALICIVAIFNLLF